MLAYVLRRLLMIVPVLVGISVIVFLVIWLIPGDPAHAILGTFATPENVKALNAELGLDRPLPEQYLIWIGVWPGPNGFSVLLTESERGSAAGATQFPTRKMKPGATC